MASFERILVACTVFVDGVGKLGSAEKMTPPRLKKKTEEHRGGGMLMGRKVTVGYEIPEFEIEFNNVDEQVLAKAGLFSSKFVPLTFRGALDGDKTNASAVMSCVGEFEEMDTGAWEAGKKAVLKVKGTVTALKLTIAGKVVYDIDVIAGTYIVDGTDAGGWINTALGY